MIITTKEINEVIAMIQVCKNSAKKAYDPHEGGSTYITGVNLESFSFVMAKAIAILKEF